MNVHNLNQTFDKPFVPDSIVWPLASKRLSKDSSPGLTECGNFCRQHHHDNEKHQHKTNTRTTLEGFHVLVSRPAVGKAMVKQTEIVVGRLDSRTFAIMSDPSPCHHWSLPTSKQVLSSPSALSN